MKTTTTEFDLISVNNKETAIYVVQHKNLLLKIIESAQGVFPARLRLRQTSFNLNIKKKNHTKFNEEVEAMESTKLFSPKKKKALNKSVIGLLSAGTTKLYTANCYLLWDYNENLFWIYFLSRLSTFSLIHASFARLKYSSCSHLSLLFAFFIPSLSSLALKSD